MRQQLIHLALVVFCLSLIPASISRGGSSNALEPLYVALANATGSPAIVAHDDSDAAKVSGWRRWVIPLQSFADQGVNLTNVATIAIGLGSKAGASAGGTGTMYIDDIRLEQQ